jgi:hypothetical protein
MANFEITVDCNEILVFQGGIEIQRFSLTDDLAKAHNIMEELSQMRETGGSALHRAWKKDDIFFWSMYNEPFFWHALRPAVKYRKLFVWLMSQPEPELKTDLFDLAAVWNIYKGNSLNLNRPGSWRKRALDKLQTIGIFLHDVVTACRMRLNKTQVLVFGATHDDECGRNFRLRDIYDEFNTHNIRFVTCYLFSGFRRYLRFLRTGNEIAFYLPHTMQISTKGARQSTVEISPTSLEKVEPDLAGLLPSLIRYYGAVIESNMYNQRFIRTVLRLSGVSWIVGIDDHTGHSGFVPACKFLGIETIAVQTGPFRSLNIGWICPGIPKEDCVGYDKLLVWSPYWQKLLARMSGVYRENQLLPCGFIRPNSLRLKPKPKGPPHSPLRVLFAWEFLALPNETSNYLNAMVDRGMEVTLKIRPDTSVDVQLAGLPRDRIKLLQNFHEDCLADYDVCAGTFTTVMYELYHLGMPLWYLPMGHDFGHQIVEDKIARKVSLEMLENPEFCPLEHLPTVGEERELVFGGVSAPTFLAKYLSQISGRSV